MDSATLVVVLTVILFVGLILAAFVITGHFQYRRDHGGLDYFAVRALRRSGEQGSAKVLARREVSIEASEYAFEVRSRTGATFRASCTHPWTDAEVDHGVEVPVRFDAAQRVVVDVVQLKLLTKRREQEARTRAAEDIQRALRG